MPGGRPRTYGPAILIKARRYVNNKYPNAEEVIPTIEGLAVYLGVSRETIRVWAKDPEKREFSGTVETLMSMQGKTLLNGGLSGNFNSVITKLALSSNHGMRERVDMTSDDKVLPAPVTNMLDKVYGPTIIKPTGEGEAAPGAQ
ncbi:MAG: terminase small subunit [Candidatus Paceibacterota bacterium]|jgi:hypothetical protein